MCDGNCVEVSEGIGVAATPMCALKGRNGEQRKQGRERNTPPPGLVEKSAEVADVHRVGGNPLFHRVRS